MAEWYVKIVDGEHGPISSANLKMLARNGRISPESRIRRSDRTGWFEAKSIKGLFEASQESESPATAHPVMDFDPAGPIPPKLPTTKIAAWHLWPIVATSVACCFPVGFALVWTHPTWVMRTKLLWTGGFLGIFLFGMVSMRADQAKSRATVAEAHSKWDKGDRAGAVSQYRALVENGVLLIEADDRVVVFQRVIDHDAESGKEESALKLLLRATQMGLSIAPETKAGQALRAEQERMEAAAERKFAESKPIELREASFGGSQDERVQFEDETSKFKGKAVRMLLVFDRTIGNPSRLQKEIYNLPAARIAEFRVYSDWPQTRFDVMIDIPDDLAVPKLHRGDNFFVTFFCESGSTQSGNRAIKIERQ